MARNLSSTYSDATTFVFDVDTFFNQILDGVSTSDITSGLRNTTDACKAYDVRMLPSDTYEPECGVPIGEYFWKDLVHPTYTIMNATAKAIVDHLVNS